MTRALQLAANISQSDPARSIEFADRLKKDTKASQAIELTCPTSVT